MKGQNVRLIDVLLLGPFMMWAAQQPRLPQWGRDVLFWSGVLTVLYNGRNYLIAKERGGTKPAPRVL